ncbi:MAG: carbohydrate-binding domain-containing protein, partial [Bacteroidaceae bacterium]|nr:carbohydrate-binding domain-containing protein [Bacteroidaceae bacterium]
KAKVTLDNLSLTSQEGAPLHLKNKKKVEVVAAKGTENTLTITACNDTANHKAATIWAKDKLLLSGKGTLNIIATGDGCRGIKSKKDITIEDITLNVTTSGNNLGEKPFGPPGGMPPFNPDDIPEEMKKQFEEMRKQFDDMKPQGGFPGPPGGRPDFGRMRPEMGDSLEFDFPEMPEGGGFGGKHKYVASTKGIASKGKITINSGNVSVRTSTAGAEGIEGKEGVVFNGGNVDVLATDDAVNAGDCIEFNGANVIARSTGNDAVDSNPKSGFFSPFGNNEQSEEPAIIIRGGTVYAWSQVGSPEEGLDCDFAALVIEGGKVFSVGGGMGEMPSVPTNENAKQPTALLIGLGIEKDEPVNIYDADNKLLDTVTIPFSLRRSASLVSNPAFKLGKTYTVKTKGYEKTFTFKENFTTVR